MKNFLRKALFCSMLVLVGGCVGIYHASKSSSNSSKVTEVETVKTTGVTETVPIPTSTKFIKRSNYQDYSYDNSFKIPNAIIVCRTYECAPADRFMSREFLYNSMIQLLDNNMGAKIQVCEADDKYQRCYDNHIRFPVRAGAADGFAVVQTARLYDIKLDRSNHKADIVIGFDMYYNGTPIECTPSTLSLFSRSTEYMVLEDAGFRCGFTTMGNSMVSLVLAVDFLDLDYGIIGGFYSFGMSGSARGGSNGYLLMKFENNSYPENPRFISPNDLGGNVRKGTMPTVTNVQVQPAGIPANVQTYSIMDYQGAKPATDEFGDKVNNAVNNTPEANPVSGITADKEKTETKPLQVTTPPSQ